MKSIGTLDMTARGEREIVMARRFAAPRQAVFEALVRPELLKRWMGPAGWTLESCDIDLRAGGRYRYGMRGPDGAAMGWGGTIREVVPGRRIVQTELFDVDWTGGETLAAAELEEAGGETLLTTTILYPTREARDAVFAGPMGEGVAASYDRLDGLLAEVVG
ncbi:MAG TPA: SRPBCC family protein [Azospirillaceae bacterium]|nr:SRPBCC family protein [Azospirillaceae bacterium]